MVTSPSFFGSSSNPELVRLARELAEQKGLQFHEVISAIEDSIKTASQKQYGKEHLRVEVNPLSGETTVSKAVKVIESREDYDADDGYAHALLSEARIKYPNIKVGEVYYVPLEQGKFSRVHVQAVRRHLINKLNDIERDKQYAEYSNRIGDMIFGVVKRIEYGNIVVEHSGQELCLPLNQLIGEENFRSGDRIKACIDKVRRVKSGPQVLLSRSSGSFLIELLKQEVPEVYDGIIEIKSVARVPGVRAKVAVYSSDPNIDAVGSCIGRRGMRINNVSKEVNGEKIDIIVYSADLVTFAINALAPAEISRVIVDEKAHKVEIVSAENKLSLAIGKGGINVRLASRLIGWDVDILSEDMETKKRVDEFNLLTSEIANALDVEEIIAQLLLAEGYGSVAEIANSTVESLSAINGFNEEISTQLIERGTKYINEKQAKINKNQGGALADLLSNYNHLLIALNNNNIKTLEDFADLAIDDVTDLVGSVDDLGVSEKKVGDLILNARKICGLFDN